jgi:hypothetical protein
VEAMLRKAFIRAASHRIQPMRYVPFSPKFIVADTIYRPGSTEDFLKT